MAASKTAVGKVGGGSGARDGGRFGRFTGGGEAAAAAAPPASHGRLGREEEREPVLRRIEFFNVSIRGRRTCEQRVRLLLVRDVDDRLERHRGLERHRRLGQQPERVRRRLCEDVVDGRVVRRQLLDEVAARRVVEHRVSSAGRRVRDARRAACDTRLQRYSGCEKRSRRVRCEWWWRSGGRTWQGRSGACLGACAGRRPARAPRCARGWRRSPCGLVGKRRDFGTSGGDKGERARACRAAVLRWRSQG